MEERRRLYASLGGIRNIDKLIEKMIENGERFGDEITSFIRNLMSTKEREDRRI